MEINEEDFDEILEIQRNKPGRRPTREKYRKRVKQAYDVLIETAKNRDKIYYGELMDEIGTGRGYIGPVLGGVSRLELRKGNSPLSALAIRKETDMPGNGFWENLLKDFGRWEEGDDREQTWRDEVKDVYNHWAR